MMYVVMYEDFFGEYLGMVELYECGSGIFKCCFFGEMIYDECMFLFCFDGIKEWILILMLFWYEDGVDVVVGGVLIIKMSVSEVVEFE